MSKLVIHIQFPSYAHKFNLEFFPLLWIFHKLDALNNVIENLMEIDIFTRKNSEQIPNLEKRTQTAELQGYASPHLQMPKGPNSLKNDNILLSFHLSFCLLTIFLNSFLPQPNKLTDFNKLTL